MAADDTFTREQVAERGTKERVLMIIDNRVYDLSAFVDEHPGGHEVLVGLSGKDASEDFHDASHTLDAKELMVKYRVGELVDEDKIVASKSSTLVGDNSGADNSRNFFFSAVVIPMVLGILLPILYVYLLDT